jgi:hypothetical protein
LDSLSIVPQIEIAGKTASHHLSLLLRQSANELTDFAKSWNEIKETGLQEGFSEQELIAMLKPLVREQLKKQGIEPKKINNTVYYLVHQEQEKERNKEKYQNKKVLVNQYNEESSFTDKSALDEIARLRTQLEEAHETIKNISFCDNPDLFAVRKDSDTYFENVTLIQAATIIRSTDSNQQKKINFAYEEIDEK